MIEKKRHDILADHPIRALFHQLTERGMGQLNLHDPDTIQYVTNLLTEFVQIENMYRIKDESGRRLQHILDILTQACAEISSAVRRDYYKQLDDLMLLTLGLFPECLAHGCRTMSPDSCAEPAR